MPINDEAGFEQALERLAQPIHDQPAPYEDRVRRRRTSERVLVLLAVLGGVCAMGIGGAR